VLKVSDFDFELPPRLIAQRPPVTRDAARLLVLHRETGEVSFGRFPDLLTYLNAGDVLVLNETRVLAARMFAQRADTGGKVEILLVRPGEPGQWWAMGRPGRQLRPGRRLRVREATIEVLGSEHGLYALATDADWTALMEHAGHVPLPPYIRRPDEEQDRERYQTVFARVPGAIAAPTAGLHFTTEILEEARRRGISTVPIVLHVGTGTFKPVTVDDPHAHVLDAEYYEIPDATAAALAQARASGRRIVAVGTTVARTLETGALLLPEERRAAGEVVRAGTGWTRHLIAPPYRFLALDALVTNFHLPRSSLLFLVSALAGRERVLEAYGRAIAAGFRFYSYGDAMLVI
jgi:S-adenosylmethionine:tRNA ribosyltransferase-isomerase